MIARWQRYEPLSGILFVVLAVIAFLIGLDSPDFNDDPSEIAEYYVDDSGRILASEFFAGLAFFVFFWFVGAVRNRLRVAETPRGGLPALALAGGTAGAAIVLVAIGLTSAAALRAGDDDRIDPAAAAALWDASGVLYGLAAPIALAVFVAATGLVSIATGVLPRWLGWISIVVALAFLVPIIAWIVWLPFALWVLVVSVLLYRTPGEEAVPREPAARTADV